MEKLVDNYLYYLQNDNLIIEQDIEMLCEKMDIRKITSSFNKLIKQTVEPTLKKFGINKNNIITEAKKTSSEIKAYYEKGLTPEKAAQQMKMKMASSVTKIFKHSVKKVKVMNMEEKAQLAIVSFIIILYIHSIVGFLVGLFAPEIANAVVAIVLAPITEEAAKNYFVSVGMPWVGTGIVFGIEFLIYFIQLALAGIKVSRIIALRAAGLAMHFTNQAIQKKIIEMGDGDARFAAWLAGYIIHVTWNIMSTIKNEQISAWAMS